MGRSRVFGRRLKPKLSYANVMATVALFIALGGSAWAVAANSIGSRELKKNAVGKPHIKKNAVTHAKLRNASIRTPKVRDGAITAAKLAPGVATSGPQGVVGPQGPPGLPGVVAVTRSGQADTETTAFGPIPNASATFTQQAGGGAVIVTVSGEFATNTTTNMEVRASMAGVGIGQPDAMFIGRNAAGNFFEARTLQFVFPAVPPGTHTVSIEFRSLTLLQAVSVHRMSLVVQPNAG